MNILNHNDLNFIERFLKAFKTIGGDETGFINFELFRNYLTEKNIAEVSDVIHIFESENHLREGKLDFIGLCSSIVTAKIIFNNSLENGKISPRVNSRMIMKTQGLTQLQNSKTDTDLTSSSEGFIKSLKGLLFNINGDFRSYRYQLELFDNSPVEIFAKPISYDKISKAPIEVLIFQDSRTKAFITSSLFSKDDICTIKVPLRKGKYIIIPILLKWDAIGKSNSFDSLFLDSLIHIEGSSGVTLTTACIKALKTVFDSIDIDGNGLLNQTEFEFFIRHTTGETASGEWNAIEDNFKMDNGQLTFEGFLELYKMVLQTDPTDVTHMLEQMGLNESLELENAQPFNLVVKAETAKFNLIPLSVSSYSEVSDKVLRKVVVEHGSSRNVKNMNDLFLYIHQLPHRVTIVVQNQSHAKIDIRLDCSKSENCTSNRGTLDFIVEIPPRSGLIGHHLFPIDNCKSWNVECEETVL